MIKAEAAQATQLLAAAGTSGAAVRRGGHDVAVTGLGFPNLGGHRVHATMRTGKRYRGIRQPCFIGAE